MEDRTETGIAAEGPASARPVGTGRKVLVSAVKNEAPFLLEWVAYHKAIGFDEIVLISNESNDGTEDLLAALAEAGEIVHHKARPQQNQSPQMAAVAVFEKREGYQEGSWYLWLDADEFLNIHVGARRIDDLIAAVGDREGIHLNWRIFGTSGHQRFPGRFVSGDFTGASSIRLGANRETKSLFRKSPGIIGFGANAVYRPRLVEGHGLTADNFLAGNGQPLVPSSTVTRKWLAGETVLRNNISTLSEAGWALAQINHYAVRTPEFFRLKALRGRGAGKLRLKTNSRHTDEFFRKFNLNGRKDDSIAVWEDEVSAEIARLSRHEGVAAAVARSETLVKEVLAGLDAESGPDQTGEATVPVATVPQGPGPSRPRRVLFSAMKNEAPFLLEWVAYHKAIGFDQIVICSNPSNDGTEELLAALAEAGEITHLRTTPTATQAPQALASKAFAQEIGYRPDDWYLWLDADEFLNVHTGDRTVDALIKAAGDKSCLLLNWRVFGTSGNDAFPGRFISAAFPRASLFDCRLNRQIKSMFRMGPNYAGFAVLGIHRPLLPHGNSLGLGDLMTGNGKSPPPPGAYHTRWLTGVDSGRYHSTPKHERGWALAQINHYMVRTWSHFQLKRVRGRGWVSEVAASTNSRHTDEFFVLADRNEAEDRSILAWEGRVTAEIKRLLSHEPVANAAAAVDAKAREIMSALPTSERPAAQTDVEPSQPSSNVKLTLPAAEGAYLRKYYEAAQSILEYGSGGSTVVAARAGCRVTAVESDKAWADNLAAELVGISDAARVHHVDIGPTRSWGKPRSALAHERFHTYALSVWDRPDFQDPDLVLIDGRFRAACLAAVKMRARRPTTVLFDDYVDRRYYHAVENLAVKEEVVGRLARFTVTPGPVPPEMLTQVIGWFSDPR